MSGDTFANGGADAALVTKIICLVLLGVIAFCCGVLPLVLARLAHLWRQKHSHDKPLTGRSPRVDLLVSCVLCLGAGVLLGTVFTHIIPEIRELFDQIESADLLPGMQTPAAEIFLCVGFFLVYFVEELVHAFLDMRDHKKEESFPMAERPVPSQAGTATTNSSPSQLYSGDIEAIAWNESLYASALNSVAVSASPADPHSRRHRAGGHDHGSVIATLHAFRAYIVVLALSVHSVFEGFAVAFESSSRDVWLLFGAIATHKAIMSFCLGEQLLATKRSVCFIVSNLLVLASASPIGVTVGLAVQRLDLDEASRLVSTGILQSLAAGTIIYVVFFEILGPERQKHSSGLLKFVSVLAGFCLIVAMHSSGGHQHGMDAAGHSHAGGDVHSHHEIGHQHSKARLLNAGRGPPLFQSDYLARVHSESGHVLDTVRYIQSFHKQEAAAVEADDVISGMRSIVHDVTTKIEHDDHSQHDHHHVVKADRAGDGSITEQSNPEPSTHMPSDSGQQDAPNPAVRRQPHDEDKHAEEAHERDDEETTGEKDPVMSDNGTHWHNHDHFMRTVEDLAGQMKDIDSGAVSRTVHLIDTLDLIASEGIEQRALAAAHADHHGDEETLLDAHGWGDDADSQSYSGLDRKHLPAQADQHVQFVLQDPFPSASSSYATTRDEQRQPKTSTVHSDLLALTEVQFHEDVGSTSTPRVVSGSEDLTGSADGSEPVPIELANDRLSR